MRHDQAVKFLIIAGFAALRHRDTIQAAHAFHQPQKRFQAVAQVFFCYFSLLCAHSFDIHTDDAALKEPVIVQHEHLIKGTAQVD